VIAAAIAQVARGRNGAQDLPMQQARKVLHALLKNDADPLQLGAFLIAQRMKGETAEELAGFVLAARDQINGFHQQSIHEDWVDLPCYAGKRRAAPAHLVAALRWRDQGHFVVVHGVPHIEGRCTAWALLQKMGVAQANTLAEAAQIMQREHIVYLDLSTICPPLMRLYDLRERLGVRSFVHTVARLLNPLRCGGQLNGVFHTPYVERMITVNRLLQQPRSIIFMGAEGEPELYSHRQKRVMVQTHNQAKTITLQDLSGIAYPKEIRDAQYIETQCMGMFHSTSDDDQHRINRSIAALRWAAGKSDRVDF